MCGLPGSGKTTRGRELEVATGAYRLSPDEWLHALGHDAYDQTARAAVEALQWTVADALLVRGHSVILENGFWSRAERLTVREAAKARGADVRVHYLEAPPDELRRRLVTRNAEPATLFRVDPADLDGWAAQFEPPGADELLEG